MFYSIESASTCSENGAAEHSHQPRSVHAIDSYLSTVSLARHLPLCTANPHSYVPYHMMKPRVSDAFAKSSHSIVTLQHMSIKRRQAKPTLSYLRHLPQTPLHSAIHSTRFHVIEKIMFTIQASQAQRVPFVVVYQSVLASAIGIIPSIWDGRIDALRCNTFVLTMQYRLGRQASLLSGINLESRGCR